MAENNEPGESDCGFLWDENSQLYYHASTGFYHDPQAGWYYSSSDGLYYKFEDGKYVLLDCNQAEDQIELHKTNCQEETFEAQMLENEVPEEPSLDSSVACNSGDQSEYPPPPSEWLEDTLIDMYLSGYSNRANYDAASEMTFAAETNETDGMNSLAQEDDDSEELEEGEWIPDDPEFWNNLSEKNFDEGISQEEENWLAQYGQVSQVDDEWMSDLQVMDLWDWTLVRGTKKDGKTEVARLIGRKTKRSIKLHPSVPSGGGILKTAPIREVHLNLVRVASGRIYRLRIPSLQYVASLAGFDASNPTKDWGFPQLIINNAETSAKCDQQMESQSLGNVGVQRDKSLSAKPSSSKKDNNAYRDRAAERRALHGGFGIGPGQKKSLTSDDPSPSSPSQEQEEAAAESLNISFGEGSYARRIMEGMGWKEGKKLGCSNNGLSEPLQATGNKGTAGLGWDVGRRK